MAQQLCSPRLVPVPISSTLQGPPPHPPLIRVQRRSWETLGLFSLTLIATCVINSWRLAAADSHVAHRTQEFKFREKIWKGGSI